MGGNKNGNTTKLNQMPGYQENIYQTKLLMLYLQRGLKTNKNFELGTEIEEAQKFDDLVFKHKKLVDGEDKDHFVILQSKHSTVEGAKITYSEIFTDTNGDFGLVKYFNAFDKAKNEKLFKDGVIENAIIYTNKNFDMSENIPKNDGNFKTLENIITEVKANQNDVLSLCKIEEGKYYRFKTDFVLPKLKPLLSVYHVIARKLINALTNSNNYLSAEDKVLTNYDYLLVTEVIDLKKNTLREEFIDDTNTNGNATGRQKLRNALNEVAKQESFNLEKIINNKMIIRKNFGKTEKKQNWPKYVVDADIEEFLKTLVFATGQPNEKKLEEIILSDLKNQYRAYDTDLIYGCLATEIQKWMTRGKFGYDKSKNSSECRFISSQDAKEFFDEINKKFNKIMEKFIMIKGPTLQYYNYFKKCDIEFDDTNFKNSIETFLSSDVRVLEIVSEDIIMSSIKLYKELIQRKELIYVRLSSINDNIIDAFKSKLTNHLLVIELDLDKTKCNDWMEKIKKIIDTIQNCNEKKIIIISNPKNILKNNLPADLKFKELNDEANTLKNLTGDSQRRMLDKEINFQGYDIKLSYLIVNDDLKTLINGDLLLKILENEDIEIGKPVEGLKEEKTFYVNRTFTCEIKSNKDVYLLSGINEEDLYLEYQNLEVVEKSESLTENELKIFENAIEQFANSSINIYLLRKTGDAFVLLKKKSEAPFEISNFKNTMNCERDECEVDLISAVAGMGKSTLFSYLSEKNKEYNRTLWVIKINLNAVSSKLKTMNAEVMQFKDIVDFLHPAANLQSKLDKTIFEHYLKTGNVILYLDAFDEICPNYKQIVLRIIEGLRKNTKIKKICISTRPYDQILNDLKGSITNVPFKHYNMEPFTIDNQKNYIQNYWKKCPDFSEEHFEIFVHELFELLYEKINDQRYEFLGVALHTNMIAVALKNTFDEFQKTDSSKINEQRQTLTEMLQLAELYKKFIENKFNIYWLDKNRANLDSVASINLAENKHNEFVKQSKILALDALFDKKQLEIFLTKEDIDNLTKFKIKENGDELGIVTQIIDNKPHFIHRTFAEYFTAVFFLDVLMKQHEKSLKIIKYFLKYMINQEHAVILRFINSMWNDENSKQKKNYKKIIKKLNGKELYFVIENNWKNIAIWLLRNGIKLDYKKGKNNILHLIFLHQDSEKKNDLLRILLEKLKTKKKLMRYSKEEDLDGNTPLNVAVKNGRILNVTCMLKTYVEEKISDDPFIVENYHGENILHLAAGEYCDDDTFIYLVNLASSDPVKFKNYLLKTNNDGKTPLSVATEYRRLNKLKAILESNVDSEFVDSFFDNVNWQGENLFHYAANKGCDDDTFIYLVNLVSSDPVKFKNYLLKTNNKGETPLIVAGKYGQLNKLKAILESNVNSKFVDSFFDNVNRQGENLFHYAANNDCDDDTFIYLVNLVSSDPMKFKNYLLKTNNKGETPLIVAGKYGQLNKLKVILESNVDSEFVDSFFDIVDIEGENVFHYAAGEDCNEDTFIYLVNLASLDPVKFKNYLLKTNIKGETPLIVAGKYGQLNKLKAVLESNVDSEFVDSFFDNVYWHGENVFHLAADEYCDDDTFIYLVNLASSDPVKFKNYLLKTKDNGKTPLRVAAEYRQFNKLKAVLESNIDSEFIDSFFDNVYWHGENVFHLAADKYCDDDTFIYLVNLASSDPVKFKNYLLKTNNKGETPLSVAAMYGQLNKLKAVLESNVDSDITDSVFINMNESKQNISVFHKVDPEYDMFIYLLKIANRNPKKLKNYLLNPKNSGLTPLTVVAKKLELNKLNTLLDSNVDMEIVDIIFEKSKAIDIKYWWV